MDKAHVQHTICLVQYKDRQVMEVYILLIDEIEKTARGGNEDVYPTVKGLYLGMLGYATEYYGVAQAEILPIGGKALADLDSKLACWREYQGLNVAACLALCGQKCKLLENRDGERGSLAGACLGASIKVGAF
jgi:hypothetical protein